MVIVRTRSVTTGFLPSVSVQNVVERAVILSRGGGPVRFDLALPAENVPRQRGRPLSKKSVAFLNDDELQRVTTAFCPVIATVECDLPWDLPHGVPGSARERQSASQWPYGLPCPDKRASVKLTGGDCAWRLNSSVTSILCPGASTPFGKNTRT